MGIAVMIRITTEIRMSVGIRITIGMTMTIRIKRGIITIEIFMLMERVISPWPCGLPTT
jgi:hypothetical protein